MFSQEKIQRGLATNRVIGRRVMVHDVVTSTNDVVRRLGKEGNEEGLVVFAESQTAGRGRRGASWMSIPQQNLLFSILLRPELPREKWGRLTHMAALAVSRVLQNNYGITAKIKWPNDVLINQKKVCGMLIETEIGENNSFAILGVGLNVNAAPSLVDQETTSLKMVLNGEMEREEIAVVLLRELDALYGQQIKNHFPALLLQIKEKSALLGEKVELQRESGEKVLGKVVDIAAEGELVLQREKGKKEKIVSAKRIRKV